MESLVWQQRRLEETKTRRNDHRSAYQRDRARILHSAAFRRLQAKTQVLGAGMNDFYRTRLTHSLEAAQIGTGIRAQLALKHPQHHQLLDSDALIEAICLAHDIGHPPFGHGGEIALNYMTAEHGGFEGNAQTFRILARLEPYTKSHGMNLSRRTLLGVLKYPQTLNNLCHQRYPAKSDNHRKVVASTWHPPKGIFDCDQPLLDWVLAPFSNSDKELFMRFESSAGHAKTAFKSLDCSLMELADDIAYGIHDMEDAVVMGIVTRDEWQQHVIKPLLELHEPWFTENIDRITNQLFSRYQYDRKDAIGALVNTLISSVELSHDERFESPLLASNAKLSPLMHQALAVFKRFVFNFVIRKPELQLLEFKGQQVVMALFEAFETDPTRLLPDDVNNRWQHAREQEGITSGYRVISDYISGMTDAFANRLYQTLFLPNTSTLNSRHDF
ncbi:deoxyguanosinetriphosphate triphosphohydrolase family protein [Corallincola holothuriorum]|uniref:Deoxyguanosinetriphosphate triphosphohydrolase-like protein n=1 Tax=Corallincola holothuriorum TaxID=2282215 RepID=A0A368NRN2_9GAMM|nr:anti-phage deoxyguanosine triphosphatase [Corallincola holothuriorum]RCU52826.1 deoxyguanosinetriphosphate triphosphohydrolase family protein [Corallincola holothuriorum]